MTDAFPATAEPGDQDSIEWLYARVGYCTASRFADVIAKIKSGKESAARRNYRVEVAVSRLIEQPLPHFVSAEMQWGIDHEPEARMAYEAKTGAIVEQVGFIKHPDIEWCGGSPDGLVGEHGGLEIKCPTSGVYVETMMTGDISDYLPQVQGLLWITRRKWWDLMLYDPRMPLGLKSYIRRVEFDTAYIAALAVEVKQFISEVQETHAHLMAMVEP